ncbi:MAG: hypothetical protein P8013_03710 [Candidatus Sulfobium sp.]
MIVLQSGRNFIAELQGTESVKPVLSYREVIVGGAGGDQGRVATQAAA